MRDLLADGETGYVVDRTGEPAPADGNGGTGGGQRYGLDAFVAGWAKLYAGLEA